METLYNILHLSGAFCLIVFSVTGFALIVRWWGRLALLDSRVRFITAEIVNLKGYDNDPQHALMKLVRQRDFLLRKFGLSLEWLVSEMASGSSFDTRCKADAPPSKKRTTETSTTTETRNG